MKRWGVVLAAFVFLHGSAATDIQNLCPVQSLCLYSQEGGVVLCADSGDVGIGPDIQAALEDMKSQASYELFFDTTEYLIISQECLQMLNHVAKYLRPSCMLCLMDGIPPMNAVTQFLNVQEIETTIQQYQAQTRSLATLETKEGRMKIVGG